MARLTRAFDSPEHKQRYVRSLFATIADRYDLITVVLSFGRDQAWKRRLVREGRIGPTDHVIDLACGTGDIAFAAARAGARVTGLDVTLRMVQIAQGKRATQRWTGVTPPAFLAGDMTSLPFADRSADVITTGYGLRNVPELEVAVTEIVRVLRPGGRLLSLDFNRPRSRPIRAAYLAYLGAVGSALGFVLHGNPDTYRYIAESLRRYPGAHGVADLLRRHGFADVTIIPIFGGFMTLHAATLRPDPDSVNLPKLP